MFKRITIVCISFCLIASILLGSAAISKADEIQYGTEAIYQNNLEIYQNQRSDAKMMEYLLMEPDDEYAYMINDEIKKTCKDITVDCATDMEKLKAVHDWVCNNIAYDANSGVGPIYVYHSRKTCCQGFADLTAAMLRELGIPCKEMEGYRLDAYLRSNCSQMTLSDIKNYFDNPDELAHLCAHLWNEAWVDGRWVLMDNTWDCNTIIASADNEVTYLPCSQTYFDMGIEEFSKTHYFQPHISYFEHMFSSWLEKNSVINASPAPTPIATSIPTTSEVTLPPSSSVISEKNKENETTTSITNNTTYTNPGKITNLKLLQFGSRKLFVSWNIKTDIIG